MVYRDYWALSQWYRHYGGQLGEQHLYVVAHGADPKVQEICPKASVVTIPRDQADGFDRFRGRFLNGLQAALLELYDWVIRTDADELICLDPAHFADFPTFFAAQKSPAVFALGMEVAERGDDQALSLTDNVFDHRDNVVFSGHYSKAWAVSEPEDLVRHGVQVRPKRSRWFAFNLPEGVYLAHLKFANKTALTEANAHRKAVATAKGKGLPGKAWREPEAEAAKFFERFESLSEAPWETARDKALGRLKDDPKRDKTDGTVRARQLQFKARTKLPDWFRKL